MNDILIKTNDTNGFFKGLEEEIHEAKQSALRHAGLVLKNAVKSAFISTGINDTGKSGKYNDKLIDAIRQSNVTGTDTSVKVHILGTRDTGSGTYRLRFFEGGTKERYQKKYNGKNLKKRRYLKKIKDYRFFESAIQTNWQAAMDAFNETFDKKINQSNG